MVDKKVVNVVIETKKLTKAKNIATKNEKNSFLKTSDIIRLALDYYIEKKGK